MNLDSGAPIIATVRLTREEWAVAEKMAAARGLTTLEVVLERLRVQAMARVVLSGKRPFSSRRRRRP